MSHWTNVIFADSEYPIAAKHFAFGFETTDLCNLLNFEYSLLDDQGNLIEFQNNEDKIPAFASVFHYRWFFIYVRFRLQNRLDFLKFALTSLLRATYNNSQVRIDFTIQVVS